MCFAHSLHLFKLERKNIDSKKESEIIIKKKKIFRNYSFLFINSIA